MRVVCVIAFLLSTVLVTYAQHEYDTWHFGAFGGVRFTPAGVVPFRGGLITQEGTAVWCDPSGKELLLTDGRDAYNASKAIIPTATNLGSGFSSTQNSLIVPDPASSTRYYIFTTSDLSNGVNVKEGFHYTHIDLAGNNGQGEVLKKTDTLLKAGTEKVTGTIHCNGTDWWVLTHDPVKPEFLAYRVTAKGIEPPVISRHDPTFKAIRGGIGGDYGLGMIKFSQSGTYLAMASPSAMRAELYEFDARTGNVSNGRLLDQGRACYGISFSPEEKFVYVTSWTDVGQIDLSADDLFASRIMLGVIPSTQVSTTIRTAGGIQCGPDGRIYLTDQYRLMVIPFPELKGPACGFGQSSVVLEANTEALTGLPNNMDCMYVRNTMEICAAPIARIGSDTTICKEACATFTNTTARKVTEWKWTFEGGTPSMSNTKIPPTICYEAAGRFAVQLIATNDMGSDTATVYVTVKESQQVIAGPDTTVCEGDDVQLYAKGGVSFTWRPATGLSDPRIANPVARDRRSNAQYIVTAVDTLGCMSVDTVDVNVTIDGRLLSIASENYSAAPGTNVKIPLRVLGLWFADSLLVRLTYSRKELDVKSVSIGRVVRKDTVGDQTYIQFYVRRGASDTVAMFDIQAYLSSSTEYTLAWQLDSTYSCYKVDPIVTSIILDACAITYRGVAVSNQAPVEVQLYTIDGQFVASYATTWDHISQSVPFPGQRGIYIQRVVMMYSREVIESKLIFK